MGREGHGCKEGGKRRQTEVLAKEGERKAQYLIAKAGKCGGSEKQPKRYSKKGWELAIECLIYPL